MRNATPEALSVKSDALSAIYDSMPEAELQASVMAGLRQRGYAVWHVPDMRKTEAGLPDLVALGPLNGRGPVRLLLWELKKTKGRVTAKQRTVIEYLQEVPGVDARIVRPRDWAAISATLDLAACPAGQE